MITAGFEPGRALVCGDCGHVYDDAAGDPACGIAPGTALGLLPPAWRCPGCGAQRHRFAGAAVSADPARERLVALVEAHNHIVAYHMAAHGAPAGTAGADTPPANPRLAVEAVDFRPWGPGLLGALITPTRVEMVLLPDAPGAFDGQDEGAEVTVPLPSGPQRFTVTTLGALGGVARLAVVADPRRLTDQEAARRAARAAAQTLLAPRPARPSGAVAPPPVPVAPSIAAPPPAPAADLSRRALFRGRRR